MVGGSPSGREQGVLESGWHDNKGSFTGMCVRFMWEVFNVDVCYVKGPLLEQWRQRHSQWLPDSNSGELVHGNKKGRIKYVKATGLTGPGGGRRGGTRRVSTVEDLQAIHELIRTLTEKLCLDTSLVEVGWLAHRWDLALTK